jgi:hypothetical protein
MIQIQRSCQSRSCLSGSAKPRIKVADPYPLLDPGDYLAICTEANFQWSKQFSAWKARLVLEPQNYTGRPYVGKLCKFLDLGKDHEAPYAGPRSAFRMLWVEANGGQPTRPDVDVSILGGRWYAITVETVATNRKHEPLAPDHWYSIVRKMRPIAAPSRPSNLQNSGNLENLSTDQPSNRINLPQGKNSVLQQHEREKASLGSELRPSRTTPMVGPAHAVGPTRQLGHLGEDSQPDHGFRRGEVKN